MLQSNSPPRPSRTSHSTNISEDQVSSPSIVRLRRSSRKTPIENVDGRQLILFLVYGTVSARADSQDIGQRQLRRLTRSLSPCRSITSTLASVPVQSTALPSGLDPLWPAYLPFSSRHWSVSSLRRSVDYNRLESEQNPTEDAI